PAGGSRRRLSGEKRGRPVPRGPDRQDLQGGPAPSSANPVRSVDHHLTGAVAPSKADVQRAVHAGEAGAALVGVGAPAAHPPASAATTTSSSSATTRTAGAERVAVEQVCPQ